MAHSRTDLRTFIDIETTCYCSILPTTAPYSRNAFTGLFPGEIAARFPDWWHKREDETINAHERDLLGAQVVELGVQLPVRYEKVSTSAEGDDLERRVARVIAPQGISAFVCNFADLLTHSRSESAILYEVACDEVRVIVTSDHGSIHCRTPAAVFGKQNATQNLRYKFGEDLRADNSEQSVLFINEYSLKPPRGAVRAITLLATSDSIFLHPTRLREYQSRYRGSFLHGGVTPEECIVPVALLTPKR